MGGPATYAIRLKSLTGTDGWALSADGVLVAMFNGGAAAALIEAARTLDDLHGVFVGGWTEAKTEDDATAYVATSVTVAPNLERPPFTFERGRRAGTATSTAQTRVRT